ncbi:hypothetical protein [Agromyces atrinae]|nr:hypothetical protein [Agromyces atrinae]
MSGAVGGLLGVVGLSAAAGVLVTVAVTPRARCDRHRSQQQHLDV